MTASSPASRPILPWLVMAVLIGGAAVNPVEFNTSAEFDRATTSTGPQTVIKLSFAAIASGLGVLFFCVSQRTRRMFFSVPGMGLALLGFVFLITSLFAVPEVRTISIASAMLNYGYLLFVAMALTTVGPARVVASLTIGSLAYLLFTWALYLVFPEQGQFIEYTSAADTVIRMGGTGHPNNIAKNTVATGLLIVAALVGNPQGKLTVRQDGPWFRLFLVGGIFLIVATLIASMSRTAIIAGVAAMGMMLFDRFYGRMGVTLFLAAMAGVVGLVLAISLLTGDGPLNESAVGVVTKSGDVEELTSLTGRTTIWDEAIGFIVQRPVTGFGLDSAASVMSKEATGTHNLLLHVSFSAGLIAAGLVLGLLAWSLGLAAQTQQEWIRGILVYVLVSGLVEDTIFESFPTILTQMWMVALLAPNLETRLPHQQHVEQLDNVATPAASSI